MAIMPVSNVNVQNRYKGSNVGFTGIKENNENNGHTKPIMGFPAKVKAIPIAVLIAMSPITTPACSRVDNRAIENLEVVESNAVEQAMKLVGEKDVTSKERQFKLKFYSNTGDKNKINKISFVEKNKPDYEMNIVECNRLNLPMYDDRGEIFQTLNLDQLVVEHESSDPFSMPVSAGFVSEEISAVVREIDAKGQNDGAVKLDSIKSMWYTVANAGLSNGKPVPNWLINASKTSENFGPKEGMYSGLLETKNNTYAIRGYKENPSDEKFKTVTLQWKGGPELKLDGIRLVTVNLADGSGSLGNTEYGQMTVCERNSDKKRAVVDDDLFLSLFELQRQDKRFAGVINLKQDTENHIIAERGTIYNRN